MKSKTWAEVIKLFLEKHLIPTVISVIVALIVYLLVPSESIIIKKLGKWLFLLLIWAITFALVEMIIAAWNQMRRMSNQRRTEEHNQLKQEKQLEALLDGWWTFADQLSQSDKKLLKTFITTGNNPIVIEGLCYTGEETLLGSELVQSTTVDSYVDVNNSITGESLDFNYAFSGSMKKKYRMKDKYYELFKYGYEKSGKINHFE